jgi:hypothetical protein
LRNNPFSLTKNDLLNLFNHWKSWFIEIKKLLS